MKLDNLAIIGSRTFNDYNLLQKVIYNHFYNDDGFYFTSIISGGANGADRLGALFAKDESINLIEYLAEWDDLTKEPCSIKTRFDGSKYNSLAGFNRNKLIIDRSDFILAFWCGKSKGTQDSLRLAKEQKKPTMVIYF